MMHQSGRVSDHPALFYFFPFEKSCRPMADLKTTLRHLLEENDIAAAGACVKQDRKAMTVLIRLAYDKETLVGWRAILAVGRAARELAGTDREFLRETCRKLLWSLSDESGGIGWSAPEMLGEIVSADPGRFADLVPLIAGVFDVEEDTFRAGALYALRRIAEQEPRLVLPHREQVTAGLAEKDPRTRIFGLQALGLLWRAGCQEGTWAVSDRQVLKNAVQQLVNDMSEAWVYGEADFQSILVRDIAHDIYNLLI
jgi:hypothetical protein